MVKASRAKGRSEYTMLLFLLSADYDMSSRFPNEVSPGLSKSPAALWRYKKITNGESFNSCSPWQIPKIPNHIFTSA